MKYSINKRIPILLLLLAGSGVAWAAETSGNSHQMADAMSMVLIGLEALVILGGLIALASLAQTLMTVQKMRLLEEQGMEALEKAGLANTETWFQQMKKKLTPAVPVEKEADIMLDHNYDGIQELDNSLPPWWVAVFYGSIVFAFVYIGYSHFSEYGQTQEEIYEMKMEQAENDVLDYLEKQADSVNENNAVALVDEASIEAGQSIFTQNCVTCHGAFGEGMAGLGPNLCDPYWLHGGDIKDVFRIIKHGNPEKGMQAWKTELRPMEIHKVASYVMTFQGTNPPNAKEPQGKLYESANTETPADTSKTEELGMLLK